MASARWLRGFFFAVARRTMPTKGVGKVHTVALHLDPSAPGPSIPSDPAAAVQQVPDSRVTWVNSSDLSMMDVG